MIDPINGPVRTVPLHPEGRWTLPANRRVAYAADRLPALVASCSRPMVTLLDLMVDAYPTGQGWDQ